MKKSLCMLSLVFLMIRCSTPTQLMQTQSATQNPKEFPQQHSTRDYPYHETMDLSKLSRFERALYNTWSEMTEEDKTFIKSCLIWN